MRWDDPVCPGEPEPGRNLSSQQGRARNQNRERLLLHAGLCERLKVPRRWGRAAAAPQPAGAQHPPHVRAATDRVEALLGLGRRRPKAPAPQKQSRALPPAISYGTKSFQNGHTTNRG